MKDTRRALLISRVLDDGRGAESVVPPGQRRVHEALCERTAAPWVEPSEALRSRILTAVSGTVVRGRSANRSLWAMAACVALAGVSVWVSLRAGSVTAPPVQRHSNVGPELGRDLRQLAQRSEVALAASQTPLLREAKLLQEDTERAARMVLARLPLR